MEINSKFGQLVVKKINDDGTVLCECNCGKQIVCKKESLLRENKPIRSCGCISVKTNKEYGTNFSIINNNRLDPRNKTGYTGVFRREDRGGKYIAYICTGGRKKWLGTFDNIDDAIKARKEAFEEQHAPLIEMMRTSGMQVALQ